LKVTSVGKSVVREGFSQIKLSVMMETYRMEMAVMKDVK